MRSLALRSCDCAIEPTKEEEEEEEEEEEVATNSIC